LRRLACRATSMDGGAQIMGESTLWGASYVPGVTCYFQEAGTNSSASNYQ